MSSSIWLQKSASIRPRTSLRKFWGVFIHFFNRILSRYNFALFNCRCRFFKLDYEPIRETVTLRGEIEMIFRRKERLKVKIRTTSTTARSTVRYDKTRRCARKLCSKWFSMRGWSNNGVSKFCLPSPGSYPKTETTRPLLCVENMRNHSERFHPYKSRRNRSKLDLEMNTENESTCAKETNRILVSLSVDETKLKRSIDFVRENVESLSLGCLAASAIIKY
jgi:hypothetical protein